MMQDTGSIGQFEKVERDVREILSLGWSMG